MPLPTISYPSHNFVVPSTGVKVKLRPMLVREEKILLMAKEGQDPNEILEAVKNVVGACMVSQSAFDIDKLTIFDIEWLFVKLRAISVSNITQVSYRDYEDDKVYDFAVDLNEVEMVFPEKTDKQIFIEDQGICIVMKWPEAGLYSDRAFMQVKAEDILDELVKRCIDKITTKEEVFTSATISIDELTKFCQNLDVKTYEKMRLFVTELPHLHYVITYTNSKGNERKIELRTLPDFFTLA
jgi:hypothetical protein